MPKRQSLPVALTIAGSDSGGGAGIQADLKTFAALGVHGVSAITCLTAQNPQRVLGIEPCPPKMLRQQLEAIFEELPPRAVKTGMLYSAKNISIVAEFLVGRDSVEPKSKTPLIVDPILVSTSGTKLLEAKALKIFCEKLLPLATLVTPNLPEAEILIGETISSVEEMVAAAQKIHARFGCAVLLKGGHLNQSKVQSSKSKVAAAKTTATTLDFGPQTLDLKYATDIFFDGKNEFLLTAPFVKNIRTHGTGCTYSAAICAALALGKNLPQAVQIGKRFVTDAIADSYKIGRHFALKH